MSRLLIEHKIDILCLQETEVEKHFNPVSLAINGYELELEINNLKARTGIYVKNNMQYKRRNDLEGVNSNLVIIDIIKRERLRYSHQPVYLTQMLNIM